jgi:hypothetical protein
MGTISCIFAAEILILAALRKLLQRLVVGAAK